MESKNRMVGPRGVERPDIRTRVPHSIKVSEGIESIIKDIRKSACRTLETKLNQITTGMDCVNTVNSESNSFSWKGNKRSR